MIWHPDPDYNTDYWYELVGGPLDGKNAEILGAAMLVAVNEHGDYGAYHPQPETGRAYWYEGRDPGDTPATPAPA